jgi:hypothetical protein
MASGLKIAPAAAAAWTPDFTLRRVTTPMAIQPNLKRS